MFRVQDRISNETELIQTYFAPLAARGAFGLQDDAALISVEQGFDLVVSTDPVRAGVHFFAEDSPRDIAWKALAVNVSDLIAKGASPIGYTLAIAWPEAPLRTWMVAFSAGLSDAQDAFGCQLLGGDCDRAPGPLSIAVTAFGKVPHGQFIHRTTARVGDHVFVTGTIGDAALGLKLRKDVGTFGAGFLSEHRGALLQRYLRPAPNLKTIEFVRRFATAALDVSDGLIQDASRLARGAQAALTIKATSLPLSQAARAAIEFIPAELKTIVSGGDDFEVLFSVAMEDVQDLIAAANARGLQISALGRLEPGNGVSLIDLAGSPIALESVGYDHFRNV